MPPIIKYNYTSSDSANARSMVDIRKKRQAAGFKTAEALKKFNTAEGIEKNPSLRARFTRAMNDIATDTTMNKALGEAHGGDYANEDLRTALKIRKKK